MATVDARGQACPQPVILARRAMQVGEACRVIVDNEVSLANVSRMARAAGWQVQVEQQPGCSYVTLTPTGVEAAPAASREAASEPASGPLVVFLASDTVGAGDERLGGVLIRSFLHVLGEVSPLPDAIVCMNSGVKLAAEGSPVLDDLAALAAAGVEVLLCGTCLDFYGLKERVAVGTISNMYALAEMMLRAGKVLRL